MGEDEKMVKEAPRAYQFGELELNETKDLLDFFAEKSHTPNILLRSATQGVEMFTMNFCKTSVLPANREGAISCQNPF
jgi:hypothetical protein